MPETYSSVNLRSLRRVPSSWRIGKYTCHRELCHPRTSVIRKWSRTRERWLSLSPTRTTKPTLPDRTSRKKCCMRASAARSSTEKTCTNTATLTAQPGNLTLSISVRSSPPPRAAHPSTPPREADTGTTRMTMTPKKPPTNAGAAATRILLGPPTSRHYFFSRTHTHIPAHFPILLRLFYPRSFSANFKPRLHTAYLFGSQPLVRVHVLVAGPHYLCMYSPARISKRYRLPVFSSRRRFNDYYQSA